MGGRSTWEPHLDHPLTSTSIVSEADNFMIRELIGRLATISNSADSTTSSYTTPPNLALSMIGPSMHLPLPADAGFVERAARFSCFGVGNVIGANRGFAELPLRQVERVDPGMFSRVSSGQNAAAGSRNGNSSENGETGDTPEGSSISEHVPRPSVVTSARKRKFIPRGKAKESPVTSLAKDTEDCGENEQPSVKKCKDENVKPPEPPKDFIHVRARRGEATDSHSLAERVRREKISQRMKVLQDLVPGCNKVTGKAVMLDEIINYVQSLQRQVEFLSMKLTTMNPRMDFDVEAFVSKEMSNPHGSSFFLADSSSSAFPYNYHPHQAVHLHGALSGNMENQIPMNALNVGVHTGMDGFCEASSTGVSGLWEDELHSVVQMGISPNQLQLQRLQGSMAAGQMKIES